MDLCTVIGAAWWFECTFDCFMQLYNDHGRVCVSPCVHYCNSRIVVRCFVTCWLSACLALSHLPRLPRGGNSFMLFYADMRDSAFVRYICFGKTAQIHSGLNHSSGPRLPGQASSWHCLEVNSTSSVPAISSVVHLKLPSRLCRCSCTTQLSICTEVSRAKSARQYHGTHLPLNFGLNSIPPGVTSIGVTTFVSYYLLYVFCSYQSLTQNISLLLCLSAYWSLSPLPPQVRFVPSSLGWWQHYLPYRGIGHDPTPSGSLHKRLR